MEELCFRIKISRLSIKISRFSYWVKIGHEKIETNYKNIFSSCELRQKLIKAQSRADKDKLPSSKDYSGIEDVFLIIVCL